MDLDREIINIQRSTRTQFRAIQPIHEWLRLHLRLYYLWSAKPYSRITHWIVLFLYLTILPTIFLVNFSENQPTQSTQASEVTYDFPRWEWVNPKPTGNYLKKITTCSDGTMWAVGYSGTILKSIDNGLTYLQEYTGTENILNNIVCVDSSNVVVVGDAGTILKYNGIAWSEKTSDTVQNLADVGIVDGDTLVTVGNAGTILFSEDGGDSWEAQTSNSSSNFVSLAVLDSTHFISVGTGGKIVYTADAGSIWTETSVNASDFVAVARVSSTSAVAISITNKALLTLNAGSTWSEKTTGSSFSFKSIVVLDETHIVIGGRFRGMSISSDAGLTWTPKNNGGPSETYALTNLGNGRVVAGGSNGYISLSTNYGENWTNITSGVSQAIRSIAVSGNNLVAVGDYGVVDRSTDSGASWSAISVGSGSKNLYSITKLDDSHLVAVGDQRLVLTSADGGQTWTDINYPHGGVMSTYYNSIALDENTIIAVGYDGTGTPVSGIIGKSIDSGATWSVNTSLTSEQIKQIIRVNDSKIMVADGDGNIFVSTNNAESWTQQEYSGANCLSDLIMLSQNNFIGTGLCTGGEVMNSTDGGITWNNLAGVGSPGFKSLVGLDETHAVGVRGNSIATTDDIGVSWMERSTGGPGTFNDVVALDANKVIAVGENGNIAVSADGGLSWDYKSGVTSNNLNSIKAIDVNSAVAVGNNGVTIFTTDAGESWTVKKSGTSSGTLHNSIAYDATTIFSVGYPGIVFRYNSPANANATNLLISVNGQEGFVEDSGGINESNLPSVARVGTPYTATVYSTEKYLLGETYRYRLSKIPYQVRLTSNDPNPSNSATFNLNHNLDANCDAQSRDLQTQYCGVYSSDYVFQTAGQWNIIAEDAGGSGLVGATSPEITVLPGVEKKPYLESTVQSLSIGQATTSPIKLGLKDLYNNVTSPSIDKIVSLSGRSTSRFATSATGPWSETLNITVPAGDPEIDPASNKSVSFYFLDYGPGTSTITAMSDGLESGTTSITVIAPSVGTASPLKSAGTTLSASKTSLLVGGYTDITATLMMSSGSPASGRVVKLYSSRVDDTVTNPTSPTDGNGKTTGSITSNKVGKSIVSAFDETDGIWLEDQITITFNDPSTSQALPAIVETPVNQTKPSTLLEQLKNSDIAKKLANIFDPIVATTAILSLIPLVASIISGAPAGLHALTYGISLSMEALGIRKRRKNWGRVFDSATGKGVDLALVRLYEQKNMKLAGTIVTDIKGRYFFQPQVGSYIISVTKDGYIYPTQIFAKYGIAKGNKNATRVDNHYVGQLININDIDEHLNLDIPIDPVAKEPSFSIKLKIWAEDASYLITFGLSYIFMPTLIIGTLLSAFVAIVLPGNRNMVVSIVYLIITLIYSLSKMIKSHQFGTVVDEKGKPISGVMVSVIDKGHNTLKESRITDRFGRFSIYAEAGKYSLKAERNDFEFEPEKLKNIIKKNRAKDKFIGQDISMNKDGYIKFTIIGRKK